MNKTEMVAKIAEKTGQTKKTCSAVYDALIASMTEALTHGEDIALAGFGAIKIKRCEAHTGRNPRTGEPTEIPRKNVPKFKAGVALKKAMNEE